MKRREFFKAGSPLFLLPAMTGSLITSGNGASTHVESAQVLATIPYALIDWDFMSVLAKTNPRASQSFREACLIVSHANAPDNFWELRLPESFGTLINPAGTFQYVVKHNWQVSPAKDWGYPGTAWRQPGGDSDPVAVGLRFSAKTKRAGNLLAVELKVRNLDLTTQRSIYVWICLMHWYAPILLPKTLVRVGGKFAPYEQNYPSYFGPAGMRCHTELGRREAARLASLNLGAKKPPETPIAEPARCMIGKIGGKDFVAGIASPDAAILGGYDTNPCTDAALLIGDLGPGETRKARLGAYFGFGTPEDLWRWYQTTNFDGLFGK